MNTRRNLAWLFLVVTVASVVCNSAGLCGFFKQVSWDVCNWKERGFCGNGAYADDFRELAERYVLTDEPIYYCASANDGVLSPAERAIHLTLAWARVPCPVRYGTSEGYGDASAIMTSRFSCTEFQGYRAVAENGSARLWLRDDIPIRRQTKNDACHESSSIQEFLGAALTCLIMVVTVFVLRKRSANKGCLSVAGSCAVVFFILTSAIALTHTLLAPTGLGVYAGKAKMLYSVGGIPEGFFADAAYSSFQPAYPPGFALLTLLAYLTSGLCGEWSVQILATAAFSLALYIGMDEAGKSGRLAQLWVLAMFLTPNVFLMATMYYAEGLMSLVIMIGFGRLCDKPTSIRGWLLLGLAGLVKNEGIALAFAIWLVQAVCNLERGNVNRFRIFRTCALKWAECLAVAIGPSLAWHVFARTQGGEFYDYAPIWHPNPSRFCEALHYIVTVAFLHPWKFGFAYPTALIAFLAAAWKRIRHGRRCFGNMDGLIVGGVALASLPVFAMIFSYSMVPDFEWHLRTSVERLLWCPSALVPLFLRVQRNALLSAKSTDLQIGE